MHAKLDAPGDAIAFSNNGKWLVVGFINGQFQVIDDKFKPTIRKCNRPGKAIQVIKFSPDDSVCAMGAHDGHIITYNVENKFKPMKKLKGHHSTITHLDFS